MRARRSLGALLIAIGVGVIPVSPAAPATPAWSEIPGRASGHVRLSAVSCVTPSSCHAVGALGNYSSTSKVYAESWDGTKWSVDPSSGPIGSELRGVSCVAADWCQAVGLSNNTDHVLIEHWNGRAWSKTPNPEHRTVIKTLDDVACISRTRCVAVGSEFNEDQARGVPLIESWNGTQWSIVPSPAKGMQSVTLHGVSCVSAQQCTAAGAYGTSTANGSPAIRTLVERWNGTAWSVVPSPNPYPDDVQLLRDVSCVSASWCVAVGEFDGGPLLERWDGHVWKIVPISPRALGNFLSSVSCASATSCQAVGGTATARPLIESWDGRVWRASSGASPAPSFNYLAGVSCVSTVSCKAVGDTFTFSYG